MAYWEHPLPAASSRRGASFGSSFGSGGGLRGASSGSDGGRRELRQRRRTAQGPAAPSRRGPLTVRRPLLLLWRAALSLSSPATGSAAPAPPPPRGPFPLLSRRRICGPGPSFPGWRPDPARRRWIPPLEPPRAGPSLLPRREGALGDGDGDELFLRCSTSTVEGDMAPAAAASSGSGGGGLLVAAACGGRQGSSGGVRAAAGVWPGPIFLFTVHLFCRVSEASPCAMSTLPTHVCRVLHTAELLPCAIWALSCAPGTWHTTRFRSTLWLL